MNKNIRMLLEVKRLAIKFNNLGGMAELNFITGELLESYELTLIYKAYDELVWQIDTCKFHTLAFNIAYMRNTGLCY